VIQGGSKALQNSDTSIKVLVADDSEIVRRGIRQVLSAQTEIAILGEASNFAQTIQMASDLEPHVIVLDLHMPDETEVSPLDFKSCLNRDLQIIAISFADDEKTKALAQSLGARVLLDKMNLAKTLIPTLKQLKDKDSAEP
jgi:DNA-binding NarL/FixJ family response regulator